MSVMEYKVVFADLSAEKTEGAMNQLASQGFTFAGVIQSHWDGKPSQLIFERDKSRKFARIPGPGEMVTSYPQSPSAA